MSVKYFLRLDDACEHLSIDNWSRIETLFDKYGIKPLVGVIPNVGDKQLLSFQYDNNFWNKVRSWSDKGWTIALHGFTHEYTSSGSGLNPFHAKSEFVGKSYEEQKYKIVSGINVFNKHDIKVNAFFAPSHTFDLTTIDVLNKETNIRFISDTIAFRPYTKYGMIFIPQQFGSCKTIRFPGLYTICFHPNTMCDKDFCILESFIEKNASRIEPFTLVETKRKMSLFDYLFRTLFFLRRRLLRKK